MPSPPNAPVSFGKYSLLRELGRGGMGVVYEALDASLDRKVALKTMIPSPTASPAEAKQDEERFLREGHLAANLPKHPHIVGVYEAGVIQGQRYLAMELIDGMQMSEWAHRQNPTLQQRVALLRDAALAVHHAHEHGVIHRDLKPPNILVDGKNAPHLTDFGLAKWAGARTSVSLTGADFVVGTPAYISPEQAQNPKSIDHRTDIYSFGVMLYEILTHRVPFQGDTAFEILMKTVKNPVPPPSTILRKGLDPELLADLEKISLKALAKNPQDRYPSAQAFAADLTHWLKGEAVRVTLPPRTRRSAVPAPRRRMPWGPIAAVAGGIVAVVAVVLAILNSSGREEAPSRDLEKEKLAAENRAARERALDAESRLRKLEGAALRPVAVADSSILRPGAVGEYFPGTNFDSLAVRRIDPAIQFRWTGAPAWTDGPADYFSVRWTGYLKVDEPGPHVFQIRSKDGVRLFIDDTETIANWTPHPPTADTGMCLLEKGFHRVVLEYFALTGEGSISLSWKASSGAKEESTLYHEPGSFTPVQRKPTFEASDRKSLPGAQEAEALKILESTGMKTLVIPWGRDRGTFIWGARKPGDRLKLEFSGEARRRTLILGLTRNRNHGIFRIEVNGKTLSPAVDLFDAKGHFLELEFKDVELRAGSNTLGITAVASNPLAKEWRAGDGLYKFGIDYLRFR